MTVKGLGALQSLASPPWPFSQGWTAAAPALVNPASHLPVGFSTIEEELLSSSADRENRRKSNVIAAGLRLDPELSVHGS